MFSKLKSALTPLSSSSLFAKALIGSALALGGATLLSAGSAHASLSGTFEYDDGTSDFFTAFEAAAAADTSFDVTFSPDGVLASFVASGSFDPGFGTPGLFSTTSPTLTLTGTDTAPGSIWMATTDLSFSVTDDNLDVLNFKYATPTFVVADYTPGEEVEFALSLPDEVTVSYLGKTTTTTIDTFEFSDLESSVGGGYIGEFEVVHGDKVPGPLPILGAGVAFGFSRKLRRRIASAKA